MPTITGDHIQSIRQDRDLSQSELAGQVGIDHTYLSKIENGHMEPSSDTLLQIADELEADADKLLAMAGKVPPDVMSILVDQPGLCKEVRAMAAV